MGSEGLGRVLTLPTLPGAFPVTQGVARAGPRGRVVAPFSPGSSLNVLAGLLCPRLPSARSPTGAAVLGGGCPSILGSGMRRHAESVSAEPAG